MVDLIERVRNERRWPGGAVAKAVREAASVSQAAVAAELGVHQVTVARWETGKRRPRGEYLREYLTLLDALQQEVTR